MGLFGFSYISKYTVVLEGFDFIYKDFQIYSAKLNNVFSLENNQSEDEPHKRACFPQRRESHLIQFNGAGKMQQSDTDGQHA